MAIKTFNLPDPGEGLVEAEIVEWKVVARRHRQGQRHGPRDRDRQVARRAAHPVGRHRQGAARRGRPDHRRRHADHLDRRRPGRRRGPRTPRRRSRARRPLRPRVRRRRSSSATAPRPAPPPVAPRKGMAAARGAAGTDRDRADRGRRADRRARCSCRRASSPRLRRVHTAAAAGGRPKAKPPVRKLAKDLGIDLASVTPTGADGIITRDDVTNHASGSAVNGVAAQR